MSRCPWRRVDVNTDLSPWLSVLHPERQVERSVRVKLLSSHTIPSPSPEKSLRVKPQHEGINNCGNDLTEMFVISSLPLSSLKVSDAKISATNDTRSKWCFISLAELPAKRLCQIRLDPSIFYNSMSHCRPSSPPPPPSHSLLSAHILVAHIRLAWPLHKDDTQICEAFLI